MLTRTQQSSKQIVQFDRAHAPRVALIAKPGSTATGVGRYVHMLHTGLRDADIEVTRVAPTVPPLPNIAYASLQRVGIDLRMFLTTYPVWTRYPDADVYHFTSQNLASLLLFRRPNGKVIVTVHDIIPYMLRNNRQLCPYRTVADRLFDWMAMVGLRRADHLIADSHYTRRCITEQLGIAAERISVAHLGIDHQHFRPLPVSVTLYARYQLPRDRRYLIYVGSEDPRKNLATLLRALATVRRSHPDVALIKVGQAHFDGERQKLVALAAEMGLAEAIHWLDDVPEADLPLLYNVADLCVMPSLYEGFGFPVVEAMACGTPVVCANAASLPELAGAAALLFDAGPEATQALAHILDRGLSDADLHTGLRTKGIQRAEQFTWGSCVVETNNHYQLHFR